MKTKKGTRRALLMSALSLLLCVSMLVGTTFAWFTDSVTSANNIIKAGNLDVELEYWNGTEYVPVKADTNVFEEDTLWEPGHTEVVYLKVRNAGTLALKYQLNINIVSEIPGTNVAGNEFWLSESIHMGVVENINAETAPYQNRADAVKAVSGAGIIGEGYIEAGTMVAGADDLYMAVVVYMPESVGNEANYKTSDDPANPNKYRPEINLGINLVATQLMKEEDSFGPDYDAGLVPGATYVWTAEELIAALAKGGEIILCADIELTEATYATGRYPVAMHVEKEVVLNLNGQKLEIDGEKLAFALVVDNGGNLKITGNGAIHCDRLSFAVVGGNSTLTIENGTFTHPNSTGLFIEATPNYSGNFKDIPATVNIYGGTFDCGANPRYLLNEQAAYEHQSINVYGGAFANFDPSNGNDGSYLAEDYRVEAVNKDDKTWYYVAPEGAEVVSMLAGFQAAIAGAASGDTVFLVDDIVYGSTQLAINEAITIDLNGHTLTTSNNYGGMTLKNGASIKNGTINHTGNTAAIKASGNAGTIENVTINMTPTAGKTKTGIQVYNGKYVKAIKNVKITGATQGIEVAKGSRVDLIENAVVQAVADGDKKGVALLINAASVGKIVNCSFEGDYGVYMMLNGEFVVTAELVNCTLNGTTAALIAHDEVGISNTTNCSLTLTYDADTVFNGAFVWEFEDECKGVVKLNVPNT